MRFVDDDDTATYYATYTAYDGSAIAQQLLATTDFETFTSIAMLGAGAANKGLALFPRRIRGRYHALSRCDGEPTHSRCPTTSGIGRRRRRSTSSTRRGALSSSATAGHPIELDEGWLVLTHGVGAMRTYSIGALLLDIDDPTVVIGQTTQTSDRARPRRPGRLRAERRLLVRLASTRRPPRRPLGIADSRIGFATLSIPAILDRHARRAPTGHRTNHDEVTNHA